MELDLVVGPQQGWFHQAVPEEVREEELTGNHVVVDQAGVLHRWTGAAESFQLPAINGNIKENVGFFKLNGSGYDVKFRKSGFTKLSQRQKADFHVTVKILVIMTV